VGNHHDSCQTIPTKIIRPHGNVHTKNGIRISNSSLTTGIYTQQQQQHSSSNLSKSSTTLNPKNTINYAHQLLKKIKTHITPKLFVIFSISIIAGFLGIYMFWKVLESNNGAYSVAFVWPLVVLFTTIISYFFYNEKISTTQFIGIALVILGIFMLNIE
jgi:multidrug transporter EmrE-like cation transporter